MKKLFAAAAALSLCVSLSACGGNGEEQPSASPAASPSSGPVSSREAVSSEVFETPVENTQALLEHGKMMRTPSQSHSMMTAHMSMIPLRGIILSIKTL